MADRLSRARAKKTPQVVVERQIAEIAELMTANRWESSVVAHLAKEWGIDESTVHKRAAEASRRVRWALGDREQLREQVLSFLNVVAHEARQAGKFGDAAKAAMGVAQIAGLERKEQVEGPKFNFRSAREALEWMRAKMPELEQRARDEEAMLLPAAKETDE